MGKRTSRRFDLRTFVRSHTNAPDEGPEVETSTSFFCLFWAVEKPIILLIFEDPAAPQLGYLVQFSVPLPYRMYPSKATDW